MPIQVVKPRIRGFICTSAHPSGCHKNVQNQIDVIKTNTTQKPTSPNVLVVGASAGYGLASRIALTWGYGAKTLGVFYERPADRRRTATAGYYNSIAFHQLAQQDGFYAESLNADAFSDETKQETLARVKQNLGKIDTVVYSIAAPRRIHPRTGVEHQSALKPIGEPYTSKTIELSKEVVTEAVVEPANETEIADTVAVMGGEDLEMWVEALLAEDLLAQESTVVTYSYIGNPLTWPMYHHGTIGRAKEDLESRINALHERLKTELGGRVYLSINKAVITQASSAIPVIPLYVSILYKVMDEKGINEEPIHQMARLFTEQLGPGQTPTLDENRRIRLDDRELRADVLAEVSERWEQANTDNFRDLSDFDGFKRGFRNLFGFEVDGVDYNMPVDTELALP
jgi:enoyl-[acyl-carrier protein] reductase / trans-2-enoyl-CoA reductase (NAD+)